MEVEGLERDIELIGYAKVKMGKEVTGVDVEDPFPAETLKVYCVSGSREVAVKVVVEIGTVPREEKTRELVAISIS